MTPILPASSVANSNLVLPNIFDPGVSIKPKEVFLILPALFLAFVASCSFFKVANSLSIKNFKNLSLSPLISEIFELMRAWFLLNTSFSP